MMFNSYLQMSYKIIIWKSRQCAKTTCYREATIFPKYLLARTRSCSTLKMKNDPPNDTSALPPKIVSLHVESVAQNTSGSVFLPEEAKKLRFLDHQQKRPYFNGGLIS